MDWNDIRQRVSPRLVVTRQEPDWVRGRIGQLDVKVQRVGDLLVLLASMGVVRALSPQAALELNNQLVWGALALEGSTYVFRRVVEHEPLDERSFQRLFDQFVAEAQKLSDGLAVLSAPAPSHARDLALSMWTT